MLLKPTVLLKSVKAPLAVLEPPVVLLASAAAPVAVLETPVVLLESALTPVAFDHDRARLRSSKFRRELAFE